MAANDTDFIQLLYHTILGREGEPAGVAYYLNLLTTGKADRATVAIWISESQENAARMGDKHYVAYDVGHLYDYTAPPPPAGEPGLDNAAPGTVVPAAQFTNEDTNLTFSVANANPITVYDIDAGTAAMKATLAVTHGTLTLKSTTGLTFSSGDGTTDASMAFTAASIVQLNAALAGLIYTPDLNYNGTDALTVYVNDLGNSGIGGPLSDTDTIAITVNAVNDAPVNTLQATSQTFDQDTTRTFSSKNSNLISIADTEATSAQVTLSSAHGNLTLSTTSGISFTDSQGDHTMVFTGTITAINTALAGLSYAPDSKYSGTDTLTITTSDLGVAGSGGTKTDSDTVALTVVFVGPPNTAPVNTLASASQTFDEDVARTFSSKNSNLISIADAEATSAQVTLSSAHGNLTLSTTSGISFTDSQGDHQMVFTGTITAINAALAGLGYTPDANYNGTDTLTITTSDLGATGSGGTLTDTDSVAITLNAVNDAPVNTLASASQTFDEDVARTFSSGNGNLISIADTEATSAQVTLSTAHGNLSLSGTAGISFTDSQGDHQMVFTGTIANINTALNGLVYTPDANYNGTDTLTITTSDLGATGSGGTLTDTDAVAITLSPVNDAPVNTLASASQTFDEDVARTFSSGNGNLISIADTEATSAQVTLSTAHGNLSLSGTTGITFTDSQGDHQMVFTGTIANINTALNGLVYTPDANYNGTDTLTITTSDQGATGSGGTLTDTDSVAITLSAVNDAPVNTVPSAQSTTLNTAKTFSSGNSNLISVADIDATSAQVTLSSTHGNLTLSTTSGISFTDSQGDHQMVFTGTISAINTALNGLVYTPDTSYTGTDTLTITTSDQGATGSPGAQTDADSVAITITTTKGTSGADTLVGTSGTDTFTPLGGVDTMTGNGGTDTFTFGPGDTATPSGTVFDTITDYSADTIDFGATAITQGTNTTAGTANGHAAVASGVVTFQPSDNTLAERVIAVNDALDDINDDGGSTDAVAGEALVFAFGSDSYIYISDGVLGIGANDVLIKLTGIAGSGSTDQLTISGGDITGLA